MPGGIDSADELVELVDEHLGIEPVTGRTLSCPTGCGRSSEAARDDRGRHDLTRFVPPPGGDARRGAVLMLFGEGPQGGELLLTERAHDMRSHPGQVSFPGGSLDAGRGRGRGRPARGARRRSGVDPARRRRSSAGCPSCGCRRATSPSPRCSAGGASPTRGLAWSSRAEVHAIHHVPLAELVDPEHRVTVQMPMGDYRSPGFLIGPDHDVILLGLHRRHHRPAASTSWAGPSHGTSHGCATCRRTCSLGASDAAAALLDIDDDQRRGGAR